MSQNQIFIILAKLLLLIYFIGSCNAFQNCNSSPAAITDLASQDQCFVTEKFQSKISSPTRNYGTIKKNAKVNEIRFNTREDNWARSLRNYDRISDQINAAIVRQSNKNRESFRVDVHRDTVYDSRFNSRTTNDRGLYDRQMPRRINQQRERLTFLRRVVRDLPRDNERRSIIHDRHSEINARLENVRAEGRISVERRTYRNLAYREQRKSSDERQIFERDFERRQLTDRTVENRKYVRRDLNENTRRLSTDRKNSFRRDATEKIGRDTTSNRISEQRQSTSRIMEQRERSIELRHLNMRENERRVITNRLPARRQSADLIRQISVDQKESQRRDHQDNERRISPDRVLEKSLDRSVKNIRNNEQRQFANRNYEQRESLHRNIRNTERRIPLDAENRQESIVQNSQERGQKISERRHYIDRNSKNTERQIFVNITDRQNRVMARRDLQENERHIFSERISNRQKSIDRNSRIAEHQNLPSADHRREFARREMQENERRISSERLFTHQQSIDHGTRNAERRNSRIVDNRRQFARRDLRENDRRIFSGRHSTRQQSINHERRIFLGADGREFARRNLRENDRRISKHDIRNKERHISPISGERREFSQLVSRGNERKTFTDRFELRQSNEHNVPDVERRIDQGSVQRQSVKRNVRGTEQRVSNDINDRRTAARRDIREQERRVLQNRLSEQRELADSNVGNAVRRISPNENERQNFARRHLSENYRRIYSDRSERRQNTQRQIDGDTRRQNQVSERRQSTDLKNTERRLSINSNERKFDERRNLRENERRISTDQISERSHSVDRNMRDTTRKMSLEHRQTTYVRINEYSDLEGRVTHQNTENKRRITPNMNIWKKRDTKNTITRQDNQNKRMTREIRQITDSTIGIPLLETKANSFSGYNLLQIILTGILALQYLNYKVKNGEKIFGMSILTNGVMKLKTE